MTMIMHGAGGATLPAKKVWQCLPTQVYYNLVVGRPNSTINHNT